MSTVVASAAPRPAIFTEAKVNRRVSFPEDDRLCIIHLFDASCSDTSDEERRAFERMPVMLWVKSALCELPAPVSRVTMDVLAFGLVSTRRRSLH